VAPLEGNDGVIGITDFARSLGDVVSSSCPGSARRCRKATSVSSSRTDGVGRCSRRSAGGTAVNQMLRDSPEHVNPIRTVRAG